MGKVMKSKKGSGHSLPSTAGNEEAIATNWDLLKKELAASASSSISSSQQEPSRSAIKNKEKRKRRQQRAKEALAPAINTGLTTSSDNTHAHDQHNKWARQRAQIVSYAAHAHHVGAHDISQKSHRSRQASATASSKDVLATPSANILALDCEYVGIGYKGEEDSLARVSIVDATGECIYDKYVRQTEPVVDYRTDVSGIRAGMLKNGEPFGQVQQEVHSLLNSGAVSGQRRIVVGHAIHNDFKVLRLTYPSRFVRDTAKWKPLRAMCPGLATHRMPRLKELAHHLLGVQIQQGEHDSAADARMALRIYLLHRQKWESEFKQQVRASVKERFKSKKAKKTKQV